MIATHRRPRLRSRQAFFASCGGQVFRIVRACGAVALLIAGPAAAQDAPHVHGQTNAPASGWQLMQDGVLFVELNHQSSDRGGTEVVAPNWWMGMASRDTRRGRLTFTGMLSLDPATVGKAGYRELFQSGEALDGRPLIDRQHPHDFVMQLAAVWRVPINASTGFTIAGGPAGEPALGPVAFMHRASAIENPTAPLGHHTFDSTHVAFGVVTAAVDHGRWLAEGSLFNGREPDDNRWDFDFGRLDSFSGRLWFRPTPRWELQVSSGRLADPEQLEPGAITRTTASVAWTVMNGRDLSAFTAGFGHNDTSHGSRSALFVEGTVRRGANSIYTRFEALQTETSLLLTDGVATATAPPVSVALVPDDDPLSHAQDVVIALTAGGVRNVWAKSGFEGGIGADLTWYRAPDSLAPVYGRHPFGIRVFFRLRPPTGSMGSMINMRMSQPLGGHAMSMPMSHPMP